MNYTIDWLPQAEQELAALWLAAKDRTAINQATQTIDESLRVNPEEIGESRPEMFRITFAKPLGVLFHIATSEKIVQVVHVWQFD